MHCRPRTPSPAAIAPRYQLVTNDDRFRWSIRVVLSAIVESTIGSQTMNPREGELDTIVLTRRDDGLATVSIVGDIDMLCSDVIEREISSVVGTAGVTDVVVDLSEVNFLDSSGIGVLLRGRRLADAQGVGYRITALDGRVRRTLVITGVWAHLSGEPV